MSMTSNPAIESEPLGDIEGAHAVSLRNLLHVVYKRKWLVLSLFLCAVASTIAYVKLYTKPAYVASSTILVSPGREHVKDLSLSTSGAVPPALSFNATEEISRTVELLTGRFLAERVIQHVGRAVLYPEARDRWALLKEKLGVERVQMDEGTLQEAAILNFLSSVYATRVGESSLVSLSFEHGDPELAAKVVNLLGEMYVERYLGLQKNPKADAFFQEQFLALKQKLSESEARLLAYKQNHVINGTASEEQEILRLQQAGLRKDLTETRSKQAELQSRDGELKRQLPQTVRTPSAIAQLRERLTTLEIQANELAVRVTEQHPTLIGVRGEIQTLKDKLDQMQDSHLYGTFSSKDDSLYATLQGEQLKNDAEARALRAREQTLSGKIAELQMRLDELDRIRPEFSRLEKQAQLDQDHYRLYLTKFEEARISNAMDEEKVVSVRVLEPAHSPMLPVESKGRIVIMAGILLGGIGAVGVAFALQLLGGSLDTSEDIERRLELPVLASIPDLKRLALRN